MFRFAIEEGGPSTKQVEKKTFAQVYLKMRANGQLVAMRSNLSVQVDGYQLVVGCAHPSICNKRLELRVWGEVVANTPQASSDLMALKPYLPKLCKLLADELYGDKVPDGAIDLATGQPFQKQKAQIIYKFTDESVEMIEEPVNKPSRLLFKTLAVPRDDSVQGRAGVLTVEIINGIAGKTVGYQDNRFVFSHFGWLQVGIAAMRKQHDDAIIKAAFQDLARNLLAQDAAPTNVEMWQSTTKLELCEKAN
jgi:hypothetical protein